MNEQNNLKKQSTLAKKIQHEEASMPNSTKLLIGTMISLNGRILYYHPTADGYFTFPEESPYLD